MGRIGGLHEIPRDAFEQVIAGSELELHRMPSYALDKSWYEFHIVFRKQGPPLSLAVSGDYPDPQYPYSLDEFVTGDFEFYCAYASPSLVHKIADVLAGIDSSDYERLANEVLAGRYPPDVIFFGSLKSAYTEVATRNNALMISIC
ncbi:MAG: hypothetical protein JWP89_3924 [Schlesneria sp.]|nr:hypothetical protein [Schlesneria sp.]